MLLTSIPEWRTVTGHFDGRRTRCVDPRLRANLRRALQPRSHIRRCVATGRRMERCAPSRCRASDRRLPRRGRSSRNVGEPLFSMSQHVRSGSAQVFSEFVATFGLLSVILCVRRRPAATPFAVGAYITSAYWFTASTSFATRPSQWREHLPTRSPASRLVDAPMFIVAQIAGACVATWLFQWLTRALPAVADCVVVPHTENPGEPDGGEVQ